MAHAYTPGLKVLKETVVRKTRLLPLKGEVKVDAGQEVEPETIVAATDLPGNVQMVNVAGQLNVEPGDVPECMLKGAHDSVEQGEELAKSKGIFGMFKTTLKSPTSGTVESISSVTGQVVLREAPIPVQVDAYVKGKVVETIPDEGVEVETQGAFIQGIFGIGGERIGIIKALVENPEDEITPDLITPDCEGKILIGGSFITAEAINRAVSVKAKGIVVGGIDDKNLRDFLGYDIGVAITGSEQKGITLMITEGFGKLRMAKKTFELLVSLEGKKASINGATQIRAGVIRPEVIVPLGEDAEVKEERGEELKEGLVIGSQVRVIREPYFGMLGKVTALPPELREIETEAKVRVLELELEDGRKVIIPRANVEIIEE